jgi:NTP pyrophosphatase (non-canonical NTP hydrolase)
MNGKDIAGLNLNDLTREAHRISIDKGFWDERGKLPRAFGQAVALGLIYTEVTEAMEAVRDPGDPPDDLAEELADIIIRVADLAGWEDIDLQAAVWNKVAVNEGRPRLHGKAF